MRWSTIFYRLLNLNALAIVAIVWGCGVVFAQGFWSTIFSVCIPPYAIYLVIEKVLKLQGII